MNLFIALITTFASIASASEFAKIEKYEAIHRMQGIQSANSLVPLVQSGSRSICPKVKSQNYSSCLAYYFRTITIRSTAQWEAYLSVINHATERDSGIGFHDTTVKVLALENVITLLERVDIKKFDIFQYKASFKEMVKHAELKKAEALAWKLAKEKKEVELAQTIAEIDNYRHTLPDKSSTKLWMQKKMAKIKLRKRDLLFHTNRKEQMKKKPAGF